ncbi:unnamed protein product [Hermetia illucens]|uniref:Peptidase S1 domain-containing protein n=1 Tax=Hermetia illucens TaxID=343691 RepID=A0A7R8Z282_HERIL|nr:unnamed protein product [Hermetia illucens]
MSKRSLLVKIEQTRISLYAFKTGLMPDTHAGHRTQYLLQNADPKPCEVNGLDGTCMFVWECIKSEGQHVGMCVDSFMFGSCCAHNLTENVIIPQTFTYQYTRPTKPIGHRPRPPVTPHRPIISGLTTIERPHGAGTLVIRPHKPTHQKPLPPSTTTKIPSQSSTLTDLDTAASIAGTIWNTSPQTTQWHMTTEPNFITRPRPPIWDKPTAPRPKPPKPTKRPIVTERPTISTTYQTTTTTRKPTTSKPRPQTKPTKLPSSTQRPASPALPPTSSSTLTQSRPTTIMTSTTSTRQPTTSSRQPSSSSTEPITPSLTVDSNEIVAPTKGPSITTISAARSACGTPPIFSRPETRIVGGKTAPFGRWPWQVSVRRTSFFGFSSTHRCGGALINEEWIVTAGHCVDDLLISQIRIRVGEYDFSHVQEQLPYIERAVAAKVVHPQYNYNSYEYDLAVVKLEKPLEFADHVSPICLPATDDLLIGQNATVTGWGRLSEGGTLPSVLQEVSVPIVSNDVCKMMFKRAGRHEFIPDIFLCAGYETGGQDSCQGDSGGPLQVKAEDGKYFLAGIISWGIGCGEANLPGVCTRISKFVPWILERVT